MMKDVVQFFSIFLVVIFCFSIALTELFWYHGTDEGGRLCKLENTTITCFTAFSTVPLNLKDLLWTLFGYLELSSIPSHRKLGGIVLLGTYHLFVVVILINMLIAMMTRSFENTSKNRDVEWKFHRTVVWINYVKREFTRPPPMNLLPNPYFVYKMLKRFCCWIAVKVFRCNLATFRRRQRKRTETEELQGQFHELERESVYIKKSLRRMLLQKVEAVLMERYKYGKLLRETSNGYHWQWRKNAELFGRPKIETTPNTL